MSLLSRVRTPLYKNTGSTARDHLASERTFLAWIRTGLGFVALGIAIERFSQLDLSELLRPPPPPASEPLKVEKYWSAQRRQHEAHGEYKRQSDVLVASLLGAGTGSIAYGTSRYFVNLRLLERGLYKPAYHGPAVLSVFVAGLAGGVYWSTLKNRAEREEG